jgi:hypothetical protein
MAAVDRDGLPAEFASALEGIDDVAFRPELDVHSIPAPDGIAPHALAWSATVDPQSGGDHGISRLVILYDPSEPEGWSGRFRAVCFAKAPLDQAMGEDPFLPKVAWTWLTDALEHSGARHERAAGTSSTIISTGFGELASDEVGTEIEMRASWSPHGPLTAHLEAWNEFVCMLAGFPPPIEGVTALRAGHQ